MGAGGAPIRTPPRRASGLRFSALGPLTVEDATGTVPMGSPKERLVLAHLLARANRVVSTDSLVEGLWSGRPPRSAERTLQVYIARLRKALEPNRARGAAEVLRTSGAGYYLDVSVEQFDVLKFEDLARDGAERLRGGDVETAARVLREALALWRGDAYDEFGDVEVCAAEARRLGELRQVAIEDRVDADLAAGGAAELVPELEALVAEHPFRERLWGQLMQALYRSGRQRDALAAYQRARSVLVDELGIEPGPELRQLEAAILDQDPALDRVPRRVVEAHLLPVALDSVGPAFVGRDTELAWLESAWAEAVAGRSAFVAVVGPEGIGKTRLIAEFARRVHAAGAVVLYGRCDHAHRGARALLDQTLRSGGTSLSQVAGRETPVTDLAGAVGRFLPTWAGDRPILVVLDDLHLADTIALEVVADLAGWSQAAPVLIAAGFRTESGSSGRGIPAEAGERSSQLFLSGLDRAALTRIFEMYSGEGWSTADITRLHEMTGGVPLLVHEQASEWARQEATRQVEEAAGQVTVARARLVTTRGEIADQVEAIQELLERRRANLAAREAELRATGARSPIELCPYKGLAAFEAEDAPNFFGRERLVAELVARVAGARLLAVVGPSGSGKSSVVRAGLLPALQAGVLPHPGGWHSVVLTPGAHPNQTLARAARPVAAVEDGRWVVFIDQFEEVFTLCADPEERAGFMDRIVELATADETVVILAIRADHMGECAAFPALAELMAGSDVLVGPMRDTELHRAVELPARRSGLDLEPGLADLIVADVAGRAGALPLLSTALAETWERRVGRTLTLVGYRAAGGVNGALARMAEDAYLGLDAGARAAARRILLRLCDAGADGTYDVRRRLRLADLVAEDDADARTAIEALVDQRLLTADDESVEVAHEALLREWPRLRVWLDEDVQGRQIHRRLGDAARAWEASERDPSELYRGTRLESAADWAVGHDADLNAGERAFLDASRAEVTREMDETRRRVAEKSRANRRLGFLLAGVAVLLVLALVSGLLFLNQRNRAERDARQTRARELAGESTLALEEDPEQAILLALEAVDTTRSAGEPALPEAIGALQEAVQRSRLEVRIESGISLQTGFPTVDASPDGRRLATTASEQPTDVVVFDAETGEPTVTLTAPLDPSRGEEVSDLAFSPDGRRVAVSYLVTDGGVTPAVVVWDAETGAEVARLMGPPGQPGQYVSPTFSPDGRSVAAVSFDDRVVVWDVASGSERFSIAGGQPNAAVFRPDGTALLVAEPVAERVGVYAADDGHVLDAVTTPGFVPEFLAIDDTGARLAVSSQSSRAVQLWDLEPRQLVRTIAFVDGSAVDWSPDGDQLAIAGANIGSVRVVDPESGEDVTVLRGYLGGAWDVVFLGDGERLASVDTVGDVLVWDASVDGPPEVGAIAPQIGRPTVFQISPDGSEVMVNTRQGGIAFLSTHTGEPVRPPITDRLQALFNAVASADWTRFTWTRSDGTGQVWDVASMTPAMDVPECASPRFPSPDGSLVVLNPRLLCTQEGAFDSGGPLLEPSPSTNLRSRVVDVDSGEEVLDLGEARFLFGGFNPDGRFAGGRYVALTTQPGPDIYDVETGRHLVQLDVEGMHSIAFDDTGRWMVGQGSGHGRAFVVDFAAVVEGASTDEAVLFDRVVHPGASTRAAITDDGEVLATAGQGDGLVRLWDVSTGAMQVEFHFDRVESPALGVPWLAMSPDGSYLMYSDAAGVLRRFLLDTDDLIELAESRLTRGFTPDECRQYLDPEDC
jgi:DNA-binding SARP family transcriptional activator/WD40 repeat protein